MTKGTQMTISLTFLDFVLLGMLIGFVSVISNVMINLTLGRFARKRKQMVIEEIMSQMHDKMQTENEFSEIIERLKSEGGYDGRN